jgi:beta-galactosidase
MRPQHRILANVAQGLTAALLIAAIPLAALATPPAITYDGRSLIINGKRTLLISGAMHYPRSTPDMWPQMLKQSKAAGLNCIETYVFWEGHERQEGKYDFSERFNLPLFLDLCKQNDLYVILRVGPYVCAEWNYGGLPWWMAGRPGLVTRTWNKPYMDAMERWVMELGRQVASRQIDRGGPIILVQMENEYNNVARRYGSDGQKYLAWAEALGHRAGFEVPMIMCEGASPSSIETLNGNSVWKRIEGLHKRRPEQPALWTENWVAWYDIWADRHHTRDVGEVAVEILRFFAAGGAGVNYYMWHGGTNFGRTAMYLGTTSYDYDAPLDEYGLPASSLGHLKMLHACLQQNASVILEGSRSPVESIKQDGNEVAQVRAITSAQGELAFVFNSVNRPAKVKVRGVELTLSPKGTAVLEKSGSTFKIAYRSWDLPELKPQLTFEPAKVDLHWSTRAEPLPLGTVGDARLKPVELPHNMLDQTRDETDYGWYRTVVTRTKDGEVTLAARVSDRLSVWVNGRFMGTVPDRLPENRKLSSPYVSSENDPQRFSLQIKVPLKAGKNELLLLVSTLGMIKGDWMIDLPMSEERQGLLSPVYLDGRPIDQPWSFAAGMEGERQRWYLPEAADATAWKPMGQPARLSWYRSSFTLSAQQIAGDPWMLDADGLGKGSIWINGRNIGRYWQAAGPQRYYHLPASWLKEGENRLVILEENLGTPARVQLLRRHLTMVKEASP